MDKCFRLVVATGEATILDTSVSYVNLPTGFGSIGVLANHEAMLCAVSAGVVRYRTEEGGEERLRVSEGVASVADNEMTLLVHDAKSFE